MSLSNHLNALSTHHLPSLKQSVNDMKVKVDEMKLEHSFEDAAKAEHDRYEKNLHAQKVDATVAEIHQKVQELETHIKNALSHT